MPKAAPAPLTPAGYAVQAWLKENDHTQQWLVDGVNMLRAAHGIEEQIGRSSLWRWMTGEARINVDDATLIAAITGIPVSLWSRYLADSGDAAPASAAG
jgi:hypothetical protein